MKKLNDVFSSKSLNSEDMDFNDVFGGPPKRFSMQEMRTRFSSESEEDGLKEKPVFGEEVRSRRRQHQGDEFFNDIFKGVESYPSPRRSGSNPGSRIMSPLPPMLDHFPTSLPAHFSLPAKVSKGMELPTFGSSSPLSRFSSRSHDDDPSYESCFVVTDDSSHHKDKIKDTTDNVDNMFNQFHFSIYKWAGRGVPMLNDNNRSSNFRKQQSEPVRTRHVDKQEYTVVLKKEQVPVKTPIHAFLNDEIKDKMPKTHEGRNGKVETSSSLKLGQVSEKKEFVQIFKQEDESKDKKLGDVTFKVDEDLNNHQPQPSQPSTNPNITADSLHTDSKISVENADDSLDDNFMVEEIFDAQENVAESESCDDTKAIDAKIRQWSVGKKGNIRSLLSTLQYVLWEESGWKAVPLVDLIEANSVKRAYQKALLRLHPDKLQQKAASFQHKYTAQKVFDILQEAWDHFNTCS